MAAHNACMFTNTPDGHFLVDRHPAARAVMLLSACSGHGFKLSSAIGEIVADEVASGRPDPAAGPWAPLLAAHRLSAQRPGFAAAVAALQAADVG